MLENSIFCTSNFLKLEVAEDFLGDVWRVTILLKASHCPYCVGVFLNAYTRAFKATPMIG